MKRLLLGPARSGKTEVILSAFSKALAGEKDPFYAEHFLIVPTREHAQRVHNLILKKHPGFFGKRVVIFSEFLEYITDLDRSRIKAMGESVKLGLLQQAIEQTDFKYFQSNHSSRGFAKELSSFISELKHGMASPETFLEGCHNVAESMHNAKRKEVFLRKTHDLVSIYQNYENIKSSGESLDYEDLWLKFLETLRSTPEIVVQKNIKQIYFDGYVDFTPVQREIIGGIRGCDISIVLPHEEGERAGVLFSDAGKTITRFIENGFNAEYQNNNTEFSDIFDHIAANLFRHKCVPVQNAGQKIAIHGAANKYNEVRFIARKILQEMKSAVGGKWSHFCLITRSLEMYRGIIEKVFEEYQIPHIIHQGKSLAESHFVNFVMDMISLVFEDTSKTGFLRLIESPYLDLGAEAIAKLKNDLDDMATGEHIFEKKILKTIKDGLPKEILLLRDYGDIVQEGHTLAEHNRLLAKLLHEMQIMDKFRKPRFLMQAKTDSEYYPYIALMKVFKSLEATYKTKGTEEKFDIKSYKSILENMVLEEKITRKEPNSDAVQIYDVFLAREKEYKQVFVIGLIEKEFPKDRSENAFLTDNERDLFNKHCSFKLKESYLGHIDERYHFYNACLSGLEKVYLTYPRFNNAGSEMLPSFYLNEVKKLFSENDSENIHATEELAHIMPQYHQIISQKELDEYFAFGFFDKNITRAEEIKLTELYNYYTRKNPDFLKMIAHTFFSNDFDIHFNKKTVKEISAKKNRFSATEIEDYAKCPFSYFSKRILRAEDIDQIDEKYAMRRGSLLHDILYDYFEDPSNMHLTTEAKIKQTLFGLLDRYFTDHLYRYYAVTIEPFRIYWEKKYLKNLLESFARKHASDKSGNVFEVYAREWSFGIPFKNQKGKYDSKSTEKNYMITSEGREYAIGGKVDRLDIIDGMIRIYDYKSGKISTNYLDEVLRRRKIQIPLYMLAAGDLLRKDVVYGSELSLKTGKTNRLTYEQIDDIKKEFEHNITEICSSIKEGHFENKPQALKCSDLIPNCPHRNLCRRENWQENTDYAESN